MKCPKCDGDTEVLRSIYRGGKRTTNRRRRCMECEYRFTTIEIIVPDGKRPNPEKLLRSLTSEE